MSNTKTSTLKCTTLDANRTMLKIKSLLNKKYCLYSYFIAFYMVWTQMVRMSSVLFIFFPSFFLKPFSKCCCVDLSGMQGTCCIDEKAPRIGSSSLFRHNYHCCPQLCNGNNLLWECALVLQNLYGAA